MNSPNNIVIDRIPNWATVIFHAELDRLREQYGVRVRIAADGTGLGPLEELEPLRRETAE